MGVTVIVVQMFPDPCGAREVGDELSVSPQRAHQLFKAGLAVISPFWELEVALAHLNNELRRLRGTIAVPTPPDGWSEDCRTSGRLADLAMQRQPR